MTDKDLMATIRFSEWLALKTERDEFAKALEQIAATGDDGTQDQLAPDMWKSCREIASEALAMAEALR